MTVKSLFNDMLIIALFMLAGYFVRQLIKPLQRLFLPASLIGGLVALILGQQCLGLIEIPESFSSFSNVLIAPIMAALLFGVTITKDKVVGYLDYIFVEQGIYGMQMVLCALVWNIAKAVKLDKYIDVKLRRYYPYPYPSGLTPDLLSGARLFNSLKAFKRTNF